MRLSFAANGNRATFWRCYRRTSNNSPRNCSVLGLATWSIQTLGDGRVLSFSVAPALAQRLNSARHFVERGGRVYFGSKSPVGATTTDVRLNLAAANAVFHQLGLPRVKPITEPGTATGARAIGGGSREALLFEKRSKNFFIRLLRSLAGECGANGQTSFGSFF